MNNVLKLAVMLCLLTAGADFQPSAARRPEAFAPQELRGRLRAEWSAQALHHAGCPLQRAQARDGCDSERAAPRHHGAARILVMSDSLACGAMRSQARLGHAHARTCMHIYAHK
eukprot:6182431-Pleurochrysis_carterae.AAC.3